MERGCGLDHVKYYDPDVDNAEKSRLLSVFHHIVSIVKFE
jgi:hypothetical protein